jgi:hypothetical protein
MTVTKDRSDVMTETEAGLQSRLDSEPDNLAVRMALVDYLKEKDDIRAEGYDAMRRIGVYAKKAPYNSHYVITSYNDALNDLHYKMTLPVHWMSECSIFDWTGTDEQSRAIGRNTRKQVEDLVAIAFMLLPKEERIRILEGTE